MIKRGLTLCLSLLVFFTLRAKAQHDERLLKDVLKEAGGSVSFEIRKYDGNKQLQQYVIPATGQGEGRLKTGNEEWKYGIASLQRIKNGMLKLDVRFTLEKGVARESSVSVGFNFSRWSMKNYVMIPAVVYDGNRFPMLKGGYMPPYPPAMYLDRKLPLTFSDDPHLAVNEQDTSAIELLTWNAATPAMTFFSPGMQRGFMVEMAPKTKWGQTGMSVEESADKTAAAFSVIPPGVRRYAAGFGDFRESTDRAHDWHAGDELDLELYVYVFPAKDIPSFLEHYMDNRKELTGTTQRYYVAPMSAIFDYTRQEVDKERFHHVPYGSIYFPENSATRFQLGWIGGMMNTYPMLSLNDSLHLKRVAGTIDFVVNNMQGKSGFFYGMIDNGKTKIAERGLPAQLKGAHPDIVSSAMVRKNADALFWFCKQLILYQALNHADEIKPLWNQAVRKLAEAFVHTWEREGDLGQYVDPESGKILVYNSTAGAIAPAGLVLAGAYFHNPQFLEYAGRIADSYYKRFTEKLGLTAGCCGDISQDADSETAFALLQSFMALYQATGDPSWLEKSKAEAALCSTWVISYNYEFPKGSDLYSFHAHTNGGVWASTQNKHAAPGICTSSGDYLFRLYRATGERKYAVLLRDILDAHTEEVELPGRPTVSAGVRDQSHGTKWGCSMERIQISDAEGNGTIGKLYNGSNGWTELNGMLMSLELPGIYLQTDSNRMFVFDQVKVKETRGKNSDIILSITNPTAYDATVSLFTETSAEAKIPLGYTAFLKWKKIKVAAGQTVLATIQ